MIHMTDMIYDGRVSTKAFYTRKVASVASQATTNTMADLLVILSQNWKDKMVIWIKEENTHDIQYQILASNDNSRWETIKGATVLLTNGSTYQTLSDPWIYVKIQVMDNVSGTHGSVSCFVSQN